jgi:hypothetical protein
MTKEERRQWQRAWADANPEKMLVYAARTRAKRNERECTISDKDIVIPELCPYLKVPLVKGTRYAPSIDRIDNDRGYVPGNVEVISQKANTMKSDCSLEELLEFCYTVLERN